MTINTNSSIKFHRKEREPLHTCWLGCSCLPSNKCFPNNNNSPLKAHLLMDTVKSQLKKLYKKKKKAYKTTIKSVELSNKSPNLGHKLELSAIAMQILLLDSFINERFATCYSRCTTLHCAHWSMWRQNQLILSLLLKRGGLKVNVTATGAIKRVISTQLCHFFVTRKACWLI